MTTESKIFEIIDVIDNVDEVSVVMNLGFLKGGLYQEVFDEI